MIRWLSLIVFMYFLSFFTFYLSTRQNVNHKRKQYFNSGSTPLQWTTIDTGQTVMSSPWMFCICEEVETLNFKIIKETSVSQLFLFFCNFVCMDFFLLSFAIIENVRQTIWNITLQQSEEYVTWCFFIFLFLFYWPFSSISKYLRRADVLLLQRFVDSKWVQTFKLLAWYSVQGDEASCSWFVL